MGLQKGLLNKGFPLPECEKHFHDRDETWIVLAGKGTGYWLDHDGARTDFTLEPGDVWVIPSGYEHGSVGPNSADFRIIAFTGSNAPGAHKPGHYYVEREGYIPRLTLTKEPTTRYAKPSTLPATTRVVCFPAKGEMTLRDEPLRRPAAGQVLVRTLFSGITNGTERNCLLGGNYSGGFPATPGYQTVGEVVAVGPGLSGHDYDPGTLVYSGNFHRHVGFFAADVSKGEHPDNLVVKLPKDFALPAAALLGVASVALHTVRRGEVRLGERALVVGAGLIGQLTTQAAQAAGAVVTVVDVDADRLALAKQLGAQETVLVTKEPASWVPSQGRARRFDVVFEDSGAPVLEPLIGVGFTKQTVLGPRSRVVMVAGRDDVTYKFNAGQAREVSILHTSHFVRDDLKETIRLVQEGAMRIEPLIKDQVPIAQAPDIYGRLRDEPNSLLGAVFDWR